ncbi:MAG: hypothetical protein ABI790_15670 [Betaproteobacteria bacterium]
MNVSKRLALSAAVISAVGVIGFSYAESINYRYPDNTQQSQSDAALPCQPGPYNPHLANSPRAGANGTIGVSTDCATPGNTAVQVQTSAAPVEQQAPVYTAAQDTPPSNTVVVSNTEQSDVYRTASNDVSPMADEREPRADRN